MEHLDAETQLLNLPNPENPLPATTTLQGLTQAFQPPLVTRCECKQSIPLPLSVTLFAFDVYWVPQRSGMSAKVQEG
jgi:hypothetical protein